MARVQLKSLPDGLIIDRSGKPVPGVAVTVVQHNTNTPITVYSDETTGATLTQPLTTDAGGQLPGWVADKQELDVQVVYGGVTTIAELDPVRADNPGLSSSVALTSQQNTFGNGQTFTPPITDDGVTVTVPAYTNPLRSGLVLADTALNQGFIEQINCYGIGVGLDVKKWTGSGIAIAGHNYNAGSATPFAQLDGTTGSTILHLKNTEGGNNPSSSGTGPWLAISGYGVATTYTDGVVAGGTGLSSATAAFVTQDVGKLITVGGTTVTVAAYVSATAVTLSGPVSNGSSITFSLARLANVGIVAQVQPGGSPTTPSIDFVSTSALPFRFYNQLGTAAGLVVTTATGASDAMSVLPSAGSTGIGLRIQQISGGGVALAVNNAAATTAVNVSQSGAGQGLVVAAGSAAAGLYAAFIQSRDYGLQITNNAANAGGVSLQITRNNTTTGTAIQVINKGTGVSLDIQSASASVFQVLAGGQIKFALAANEATGAGSAALGANCPAVTATAPYTWEKVTTSDGSQGYFPVWK